jgi:hypothetical protein
MTIEVARWIVNFGLGYSAIGLVFAVAFVLAGVGRIDPDAKHGSWGFRVLVLPGAAALWPLMLSRWVKGSPPPVERAPHRGSGKSAPLRGRHRLWTRVLAIGLPLGVVLGLAARQPIPTIQSGTAMAGLTPTAEFEFEQVSVHGHVFLTDGNTQVELLPEDLQSPDVLVYWSEVAPQGGELPTLHTTLVGKLAGDDTRIFTLPGRGGWLHLYSLGHKRLLDSTPVPTGGN